MPNYCVNRNPQATGEHEVHNLDVNCGHLPALLDRVELGQHPTCYGAVIEARKRYDKVDGCRHCTPDCHSR